MPSPVLNALCTTSHLFLLRSVSLTHSSYGSTNADSKGQSVIQTHILLTPESALRSV